MANFPTTRLFLALLELDHPYLDEIIERAIVGAS